MSKGSGKSSELKKTLKKYISANQDLQMEINNYKHKLHSLKEDLNEQKEVMRNSQLIYKSSMTEINEMKGVVENQLGYIKDLLSKIFKIKSFEKD